MTNQMLIIFAIFADLAADPSYAPALTSAQEAMAVFSFFIFFIYASFGTMLAVFRNDVIKEVVLTVDLDEQQQQEEDQPPMGYEKDPNQI
jgi:hypothetical protein